MLSHGDEVGRTQQGNNNAYCQDSELTWMPWQLDEDRLELESFVRKALSLRRDLLLGSPGEACWISAHGAPLTRADLDRRLSLPMGWLRRHRDCHSLTIINGDERGHLFELPRIDRPRTWFLSLNTAASAERRMKGQAVRVPARSVLLLVSQD
jgi:glycogen operon protein